MQELTNYEEEKKEYDKWVIEFEKQKKEFEIKAKEIISKEAEFKEIFSTRKKSMVEEIVGRPYLRKCEEKYFTEKMKQIQS